MIGLIKSYSISVLKWFPSYRIFYKLVLKHYSQKVLVISKILKYSKEIIVHLRNHFVKHSNLWEPLIEILETFLLILFGRLKWISRSTKKSSIHYKFKAIGEMSHVFKWGFLHYFSKRCKPHLKMCTFQQRNGILAHWHKESNGTC